MRWVGVMLAVASLLMVFASAGDDDWSGIPVANSPAARFGHSLITLNDGRVLMFGGEDYRGDLQNEIFEFGGEQWELITNPTER